MDSISQLEALHNRIAVLERLAAIPQEQVTTKKQMTGIAVSMGALAFIAACAFVAELVILTRVHAIYSILYGPDTEIIFDDPQPQDRQDY